MRRFLISLCALCASLLSFSQPSQPKTLPWRGMMIDVSRHFVPLDELYREVDIMSHYGLNTLHLHLTDAAGWRMEIKAYPRLTEVGAWRTRQTWKEWWNKYVDDQRWIRMGRGCQLSGWIVQEYGKDTKFIPVNCLPAQSGCDSDHRRRTFGN